MTTQQPTTNQQYEQQRWVGLVMKDVVLDNRFQFNIALLTTIVQLNVHGF
jgi:hypothetical protein